MSMLDTCAEALYLSATTTADTDWSRLTERDRQTLRDLAGVVLAVPEASDDEAAEAVEVYVHPPRSGQPYTPWSELPDHRRAVAHRVVRVVRGTVGRVH